MKRATMEYDSSNSSGGSSEMNKSPIEELKLRMSKSISPNRQSPGQKESLFYKMNKAELVSMISK